MGKPGSRATTALPGERFGRLVVAGVVTDSNGRRRRCRCDCGTEVVVAAQNLTRGHTKSCGCLKREVAAKQLAEIRERNGLVEHQDKNWIGSVICGRRILGEIRLCRSRRWTVECIDCGRQTNVEEKQLRDEAIRDCLTCTHRSRHGTPHPRVGQVFGIGTIASINPKRSGVVTLRCLCGVEQEVRWLDIRRRRIPACRSCAAVIHRAKWSGMSEVDAIEHLKRKLINARRPLKTVESERTVRARLVRTAADALGVWPGTINRRIRRGTFSLDEFEAQRAQVLTGASAEG